ncbi:MutS protein msh4 [Coniochaeta pulveracea]|uniref:MutS protein msh4 n=1 Tax=Coniochaeta pulveracea TaxID=177199 RepID=A0A420YBU1_9PEZI|nr:MutS protein msh4 [Coniochaeta pulveracea]
MPEEFINRVLKKDYIECQTMRVLQLNQRISDSAVDVVNQSDKVVSELLIEIRRFAPELFKVCESVALLDVMTAFAQIVTTHEYIRPVLSGNLAIKCARHPILDKVSRVHTERAADVVDHAMLIWTEQTPTFIPNDFYATEQFRFQIITGCNMSGKSTYIRTAALLQVMAQIGCFVPAEYASFPVIHNLFSRVSTDDCIEANMSTFSVEMREMAFILRYRTTVLHPVHRLSGVLTVYRNINGRSLCIIDELGRGTSTRDGLAIAIAMAEAMVQSGAFVFFVTHFTELGACCQWRDGGYKTSGMLTDDCSEHLGGSSWSLKSTLGHRNNRDCG